MNQVYPGDTPAMNDVLRRATVLAACLASTIAHADDCRRSARQDGRTSEMSSATCRGSEKIEPYDPDRVKSGRQPGFIDLGDGAELRVGGRVRAEYGYRR